MLEQGSYLHPGFDKVDATGKSQPSGGSADGHHAEELADMVDWGIVLQPCLSEAASAWCSANVCKKEARKACKGRTGSK